MSTQTPTPLYRFNQFGELEKQTRVGPNTWTVELATEDEILSIDPDTGEAVR